MMKMAQSAKNAGLKEICFTEHIDLNLKESPDFTVDFTAYAEAIKDVRTAFPDMVIRMGIEAGLDIETAPQMQAMLEGQPLDYIIGSQHVVFGLDPFYEQVWKQYSKAEIFGEYLRVSSESAMQIDYYDVMGHVGYVSKFCPFDDKMLCYADFSEAIDTLLKILIGKGKGIEINTNGLYMTPSTMPETAIIRRYFELGGEIVTIGSDAHYETVVGHAVADTLNLLKSIGFRYICTFDKRQPVFLPL
jgi:histidinol-phosphatase (PHP family)